MSSLQRDQTRKSIVPGAESASSCVPYDENLLERAGIQWQFGDWESLAGIDREQLQNHPDRVKLALLAGAGRLQANRIGEGRQFVQMALDWGGDRTLIARVLAASVHNSLGCAAALAGKSAYALKHFEYSVALASPGCDLKLVTAARAAHQLKPLGHAALATARITRLALEKGHDELADEPSSRVGGTSITSSEPVSIVVAGMRHSGSTALFNLIRLALDREGIAYTAGYSENAEHQQAFAKTGFLKLIKTHEFRDDIAHARCLVITTRRDLRDSVASAKRRKFPMLERLGGDVEYAKYNRALHDIWLPHSDYVFVYERFMSAPIEQTRMLLEFLGLEQASAKELYKAVSALPTDEYQKTLLSPTHITDPEHNKTYLDTLTPSVVAKINSDHALWLSRHGYL